MNAVITILMRGILIGISVAAPIGPIGILCIRRTVTNGRLSGFVTGMGAATADAIYGFLAGFGMAIVSNLLISYQDWLRGIGGIFLIYLGVRIFLSQPTEKVASSKFSGLIKDYLSTLILTLANPLTIFSFAAIITSLDLIKLIGEAQVTLFLILGIFLGSILWWIFLIYLTSWLLHKHQILHLRIVNRLSGMIIVGFGVMALVNLLNSTMV